MERKCNRNLNTMAICFLVLGLLSILLLSWHYKAVDSMPSYKAVDSMPNVIIITLEGVRNSESIDDLTHQYIPNIWNKLRGKGTLYTNLVNINCEFHIPSQQAINTGDIYEASWDLLNPTLFHYVKDKYRLPNYKLWMIGHWDKTNYSLHPYSYFVKKDDPCVFSQMQPDENHRNHKLMKIMSIQEKKFNLERGKEIEYNKVTEWPVWDSASDIAHEIVMKIFRVYKPKLVHYVLSDTESAHYGNYAQYVMSLKAADEKIAEVWEFIKKDPYYKDNTYLFINVDGPRDAYYQHHNKSHEPVWLYAFGPDVKQDKIIQKPIYHIDIFSTIAHLMKIETHETKGRILSDCFIQ